MGACRKPQCSLPSVEQRTRCRCYCTLFISLLSKTFLQWSCLDFYCLYELRGVYYLCDAKPKHPPLMHEVLDKDTIKSKILHHLSVAKRGYVSKMTWRKSFYTFSTSQKTGCRWQMTSAFPWYCFRWPWAVCPTTTRVGGRKRTCFLCRCPCART